MVHLIDTGKEGPIQLCGSQECGQHQVGMWKHLTFLNVVGSVQYTGHTIGENFPYHSSTPRRSTFPNRRSDCCWNSELSDIRSVCHRARRSVRRVLSRTHIKSRRNPKLTTARSKSNYFKQLCGEADMGKHLQRYNVEIQESSSFAIYMRRSSPENCSGLLPPNKKPLSSLLSWSWTYLWSCWNFFWGLMYSLSVPQMCKWAETFITHRRF